jgi:hypothetical protein
MTKLSIELILSAEDRAAITEAVAAQISKASGKGTTPAAGRGGKNRPAAETPAEDDFEETDGVADAEADGAGDDDFEADEAPAVTKADVQEALRAYAAMSSKADAMKLISSHGKADGLSNLKEANFAAVIKAAKAATAKAKKE